MKRNMVWILIAVFLLGAKTSHADSYLAVVASGDNVVNLYRAHGGIQLIKSIPVGKLPTEMCAEPNGKRIFVSVVGDKKVAVIDVASQSVIATMSDPSIKTLDGCAVSPDSKKLYVNDGNANVVLVFSTESNHLLKQIPVGKQPRRALFSPDGRKLLISNAHSDTISVIDPSSDMVVNTLKTGLEPRVMTYTPDGKWLVVGLIDGDSLSYYKADTLEFDAQIGVTRSPQRVIVSPNGDFIYVLGAFESVVGLVDLRSNGERRMVATIPIGHECFGMAMSPDGKYLYTASPPDNVISVIDVPLMKVARTVSGGKGPNAMLFIQYESAAAASSVPSSGPEATAGKGKMDRYRSLARMAMDAFKKNDLATASKLCETLESEWDENQSGLRSSAPDVWGQIDRAMDQFIHPIMASGRATPNAAEIDAAYREYLGKLKLAD